jgi:hypothetical protein
MTSSSVNDWLSGAPLWLLSVAVPVLMIVAVAVGILLRGWSNRRRRGRATEGDSFEGYIVQAVLGLLALLMAFTYSLAIDRFEMRRALVLEEANAIGTVYLRAQLLEEPHRARISQLLREYTDVRLALATARSADKGRLLDENDRLIVDLWAATSAAFVTARPVDFSTPFLNSMNALIDLDTARRVARTVHVPTQVFVVLFVYLIVTAGVLGYVFVGHRGRVAGAFVLILLTLFLLLVFDIDRPTAGNVQEAQTAMEMLKASLSSQASPSPSACTGSLASWRRCWRFRSWRPCRSARTCDRARRSRW